MQYSNIVCEDGSRYCGECRDNVSHGLGVLVNPGKGIFEGLWKSGQQVSGTFSWNTGKQYMGEWKDMCRTGLGVETRPNGTRYFGEFTQNVMGPLGVLSLPDQGLYLGMWQPNSNYPGGEKDGEGVEAYSDGGYYRGQYKNGMRNGYGTRTSAGYEALHLDTLKRSAGTRPSMANIVIDRTMSKGNRTQCPTSSLQRTAQSEAMQNQVYEGQWVDDRRTGYGILKVSGFYTYYGQWLDNQRTGYGVLVKETLEVDGKELDDEEETRQEGLWRDGKLEQPVKHKMFRKNDLEVKVKETHAKSIEAARIARQKAHVAEDRADAAAAKCQAAKGRAAKANENAEKAFLKSQEVVKNASETMESAKEIKGRVELMTGGTNKDLTILKSQPSGSATLSSSFNYKQLSLDMMTDVKASSMDKEPLRSTTLSSSANNLELLSSKSKSSSFPRGVTFNVNADSD